MTDTSYDNDRVINQAEQYGVYIATWVTSNPAWRAVGVRRLSGAENGSKRNVFVDVLNADGSRDRNPNLRLCWSWEGRRPDEQAPPVLLDKPDMGELGHGNVPINANQKITVWIEGDGLPSDRVAGMHTGFPDEGPGNTWGHFSYKVVFQRQDGTVTPPVVVGPGPGEALTPWQQRIERELAELQAWRNSLEGDGR